MSSDSNNKIQAVRRKLRKREKLINQMLILEKEILSLEKKLGTRKRKLDELYGRFFSTNTEAVEEEIPLP